MNDTPNTNWQIPATNPTPTGKAGCSSADIEQWRALVERVANLGTVNNWSKAEVARRSGVPEGTFSQWFSGKYAGRMDEQNKRVQQWLDTAEEMDTIAGSIPESPLYVETRTAREVNETLLYAQSMPEMVIITLGAGMGKSSACKQFSSVRPHAFLVTMSPQTKTVHGMLTDISGALGIQQHNPAKLHRSLGERLQRNGRKTLLIVDEAQNLKDEAVDQLRNLLDVYQCGIALVGNMELYTRFGGRTGGPSYAQIRRRIGKRLKRLEPYEEDVVAMIDAWGVTDAASRKLLMGIGMKPGALGEIDKTMKLAGLLAAGAKQPLGEKHIRSAWSNRNVED